MTRPERLPTAARIFMAMLFGVLVLFMTPLELLPTAGQALVVLVFGGSVLIWPGFRRALVRRKVRRVRGARRLSKVYRRSRRHGTQSGLSSAR